MRLSFETDEGAAADAAMGLIVLKSDETLEPELATVLTHPGLALYHSRIPSEPEVTPETLRQMEANLPIAAALLPTAREMDVVAYACTSGATIIGPDKIAACIHTAHPNAKTTNPITAVMAACRHLGVKKIGFVTPYVADVSAAMRKLLEENGFAVTAFGSFEQSEESVVARISQASVLDAIISLGNSADVEAVFASCTNLRSFDIIDQAEAEIGKPVITSNQALAWHMLWLAGLSVQSKGPGRLFNH
jgi:maleate isomerase